MTVSDPEIEALVLQFNEALNRHDIDEMMSLMTPNCIFENTSPAPDGTRYQGQAAVRDFWEAFFRDTQDAKIELEELFAWTDRCVFRWTYSWGGSQPGHVRGIDVYRVEQGKIAEKLSYVKG